MPVTYRIDDIRYTLREEQDLSWLHREGQAFRVIDQTGSGCILVGIERESRRYFYKIAGAKTVEAEVGPEESIRLLRQAVQINHDIRHPALCRLVRDFVRQEFYVAVYEYAEGECLFDHWNFDRYIADPQITTPMQRFHDLPPAKRLQAARTLFSFLETVIDAGYLAVDFYDASLLYDFTADRLTICDIDLFRKAPVINEVGPAYYGTTRLKAPEESVRGAVIDERTNVFTLGAILFDMFTKIDADIVPHVYPANVPERRKVGHFLPNDPAHFQLPDAVYAVLMKATQMDPAHRFRTLRAFETAFFEAAEGFSK